MELLPLIINLVSGAVGGNLAGALLKNFSLGTLWNSVVGIIGGGLGAQVLGAVGMGVANSGTDIASIIGQIASGGVGGGVLMVIVGIIKRLIAK